MQKRPAGYVRTEGGMGLQRTSGNAAAALQQRGPTQQRLTVDFKRQREMQGRADARREARAKVLCNYFCRYGRCHRTGVECPYEHTTTVAVGARSCA